MMIRIKMGAFPVVPIAVHGTATKENEGESNSLLFRRLCVLLPALARLLPFDGAPVRPISQKQPFPVVPPIQPFALPKAENVVATRKRLVNGRYHLSLTFD